MKNDDFVLILASLLSMMLYSGDDDDDGSSPRLCLSFLSGYYQDRWRLPVLVLDRAWVF